MPRIGLSRLAVLCWALGLLFAATAAAGGALVKVNDIVLRADGGFQPRVLPPNRFAPIDFQGSIDVAAKGGGKPVALEEVVIDFDRDGRLSAGGLPVCRPEQVATASPIEARRICAGAIVGSGHFEALVALPDGPVPARSLLTVFNGPPQAGHPSVVLHARPTAPAGQTIAILVPIERRPGLFRYRATIDLPVLAGGLGSITHLDVDIGRRFSNGGRRRSYVSARCSDGILQTHGRFSFADGTIVDGSVEKACTPR
jgi:hypothetical protein